MNYALIIAGGSGNRMGQDIPKQFINVYDKPVLIYTLESFQRHPMVDAIEVVCLDGWHEVLWAYARQFNITKLQAVVAGGNSAQESIRNGVYDLESKASDDDIIIIYVENFTSFRQIERYTYMFEPGRYLFVSRLLSSNAFKDWLKGIPNRYIHFGDFDLAGIGIYLHFYDEIGQRASFLVPDDIEERIVGQGNSTLYYSQEEKCRNMKVTDKRVQPLVDMIKKFRMGYEQEGYAK